MFGFIHQCYESLTIDSEFMLDKLYKLVVRRIAVVRFVFSRMKTGLRVGENLVRGRM